MSRKGTFSKAVKHLKSTTIDEKIQMLNEIPTNSTIGYMTGTPSAKNPDFKGWDRGQDSALNTKEGDFTVGENPADIDEAKDTTGLFEADGTIRVAEPPGDTSYILGPMAAMYYTWSSPWTRIGYIRQSDRKMVNLGTVTGKLSDWDGTADKFTSYGNLTLEQAQWFRNVQKANGNTLDPDTYSYRAYYPGPPAATPDAWGRYPCVLTGAPKSVPLDGIGEPESLPGTSRGATPDESLAGLLDRLFNSGNERRSRQTARDRANANRRRNREDGDGDGLGEGRPEGDPGNGNIDWNKVGGYVDTALTVADAGLMVASLIGILIPEPATSAAGVAGVASVLSKLRWANKARKATGLARGLKGLRVGATGLKKGGYQAIKSTAKHRGSRGFLSAIGKKRVYSAPKVGYKGPNPLRPGSGAAKYSRFKSNPLSRRGSSQPGGVVGSVVAGGSRRFGFIEPQSAVTKTSFTKGVKLFRKVMGGQYKNSATANRIRSMARQAGFKPGQANIPYKNLPSSPGATQVIRGATRSIMQTPQSLVKGTKNWYNQGRNIRVPNEKTAPWKTLRQDDRSQIGRFVNPKNPLNPDGSTRLTGGALPNLTKGYQVKQFATGRGGVTRSFNPFLGKGQGLRSGPTALSRQQLERPFRSGKALIKQSGRKIRQAGRTINRVSRKSVRDMQRLWRNEYDLEGNIIMEAVTFNDNLLNEILLVEQEMDTGYYEAEPVEYEETEVSDEVMEGFDNADLEMLLRTPGFPDRMDEVIKGLEDELELSVLFDMMYGLDEEEEIDPNDLHPDNNPSTPQDPWGLGKDHIQQESRTRILKSLKEEIVIPEGKQKSYKVKPGQKYKNKYKAPVLAKNVEVPNEFNKIGTSSQWGKAEYDENVRSSQEKKNELMSRLYEGEYAFNYAVNGGTKMKSPEEMDAYWKKHPDLYSYYHSGKKYKLLRKEQVQGDYLVFLQDEDGNKSNMLQSVLNEKIAEEEEKADIAQYMKENPNTEPISYDKDPMVTKSGPTVKDVAKRLKNLVDYEDRPSPKGYPDKEVPKLVKGWHPEYAKNKSGYYKKLDPVSAKAMPMQDDPEIDVEIVKARKKKKINVKSKEGQFSDWRKEEKEKHSDAKLVEGNTTSGAFSYALQSAGDEDLVVMQLGGTGDLTIDLGGPGGGDETMKHGGEFGLKWLDDLENVDDPHNTGAFVKAPEAGGLGSGSYGHGYAGTIPGIHNGMMRNYMYIGDWNNAERDRRHSKGLPQLQGDHTQPGFWARWGPTVHPDHELGTTGGTWDSENGTAAIVNGKPDWGHGTVFFTNMSSWPRFLAMKAMDSTEFDTFKLHARVRADRIVEPGTQLRLFYWSGDKPGFQKTRPGHAFASNPKTYDGWRPIYQKPNGEIDTEYTDVVIPTSRPAEYDNVVAPYSVKIPPWCKGKNSRFMLFQYQPGDSHALTGHYLVSLRFQRKNALAVGAPLDGPEGSSFMRVGQRGAENTTPEQRQKKIEEMLKASKEYLMKNLGYTDFPGMGATLSKIVASPTSFGNVFQQHMDTLSPQDKKAFQKEMKARREKAAKANTNPNKKSKSKGRSRSGNYDYYNVVR